MKLRLSPPKMVTWIVALILGILGILLEAGILSIAALTPFTFWLVVIGLALMLLATTVKGL